MEPRAPKLMPLGGLKSFGVAAELNPRGPKLEKLGPFDMSIFQPSNPPIPPPDEYRDGPPNPPEFPKKFIFCLHFNG
jgi:hypothetical protein